MSEISLRQPIKDYSEQPAWEVIYLVDSTGWALTNPDTGEPVRLLTTENHFDLSRYSELHRSYLSFHGLIYTDDSPSFLRREKPCTHIRYSCIPAPTEVFGPEVTINESGDSDYGGRDVISYTFRSFADDPLTIDLSGPMNSLLAQMETLWATEWDIDAVIRQFADDLLPSVSLINTILELRELPELIRRVPRGLSKSAADLWLRNQYGLQPLLSEIETYSARFTQFTRTIERFNEIYGLDKPYTTRRRKDYSITLKVNFQDYELEYEAQFTGRLQIPLYVVLDTQTDFGEYLGLTADLYPLWEATPFSFLVDYFVPIGEVLTAPDFIQRSIFPGQGLTSVKAFGQYKLFQTRGVERHLCQTGNATLYSRQLLSFDTFDRVVTYPIRLPSQNQMLNIVALLRGYLP